MLGTVLVLVGALAGWLLADHLFVRRASRGNVDLRASRHFHSTGWEETVPPHEVVDAPFDDRRRRASDRAAA